MPIKIAKYMGGIRAAEQLEKQRIHCDLILFSFAQVVACAEADLTLISPVVAHIHDRYKNIFGAPGMTRTCDLLVRSQPAFPNSLIIRQIFS